MRPSLLTLNEKDILEILKEKYPNSSHIELYVDEGDEGIEGYNPIIAEVNFPEEDGTSRIQTDDNGKAEISAIMASILDKAIKK